MTEVSLEIGMLIAAVLFVIGLLGVMIRRNIIFILISVEIMLNASGLAFVFAGSFWGMPDGQIMFIFILAVAAAEVSIGLALIILIYHNFKTLNIGELNKLKEE